MIPALELIGVTKRYRAGIPGCAVQVEAVREVSIEVAPGELLGLLGPNGAGKSTLLLCAAGLLRPDSGTVRWFGESNHGRGPARGIAYVPERPAYYADMRVQEALEYYGALHDVPADDRARQARDTLARVGLAEHARKRIAELSRGMRQRLGLAQALVGAPRLLLLDETLSGLDPVSRRDVRDVLTELSTDGVAIVLSSHDMASLERVCARVTLLNGGRVRASIDPAHFTHERFLELELGMPPGVALPASLLQRRAAWHGRRVRVPLPRSTSAEEVLADCRATGLDVLTSRLISDDLEQHFFDHVELAGRAVAEGGK